jgi:hypothetical protein
MPIFVDTDNSNPTNKLYNGSLAGSSASKAESKMQATVKRILDKNAGFTTIKVGTPKGYTIRMKIAKLDVANHKTVCTLSGSITRYPKGATMKGAQGDEMVSLSWGGTAEASDTNEGALLDCVEAVTESMMKSGMATMTSDFAKR